MWLNDGPTDPTGDSVMFFRSSTGASTGQHFQQHSKTSNPPAQPGRRVAVGARAGLLLSIAAIPLSLAFGAGTANAQPAVVTSGPTQSEVFGYTGGAQQFVVPAGVSAVTVALAGGGGGNGDGVDDPGGVGGAAGTVTGQLPVTPGQLLTLQVGGRGGNASSGNFGQTIGAGGNPAGGSASGGAGGSQNSAPIINGSGTGGGGGAASQVTTAAGAPLIVAGGGGGGGGGFGNAGFEYGGNGGHGGLPAGDGSDGIRTAGVGGQVLETYGYGGGGGSNPSPAGGTGTDAVANPFALNNYNAGGGGGGGGYNGPGGTGGGGTGALQDSGGGGGLSWADPTATHPVFGQAPTAADGQITVSWQQPFSLYIADYGTNTISIFGPGAQGRPAVGAITGPATGLANPEGVALDTAGRLYVANSSASTITEYAPAATGNTAPVATIAGPGTGLDNPRFLAIDPAGRLYVVNALNNTITEYAPAATGNTTPVATIAGSATGISNPIGIAVDTTGQLYVSNAGTNSITRYSPGANGNVTPNFLLQGDQTQLNGPKGLTFSATGALIVANDTGGVNWYSTGIGGNRTPGQTLTSPATALINSEQPVIDPSDNTLLVDSLTQGTLQAWPDAANSNTPATTSIHLGAATQPTQLAINPANP